ncbi:MAG: L-threonylcarbamoyladenylate synthase [Planctomycetota bacterium]|nr:L-threonylcarbamoyladenylate synthase [Planctomycetota bacterium]
MKTEVLRLDGSDQDLSKLRYAARLLQAGAVVAFPTETVYGLGADARNLDAMAELARVKQRQDQKPYSLLVPSVRAAESACGGLSHVAKKLARIYWPGPLTLVVRKRGGGAVGMRLPEHPVTRSLLSQCGFPLAAPSANISGTRDPRSAEQVREQLEGQIPLILDGGEAWHGKASTVVRLDVEGPPQVVREGVLTADELLRTAQPTLLFVCTGNTCRSPMAAAFAAAALQGRADTQGQPYRVLSAGTSAQDGDGANPSAQAAMSEVDLDLRAHRAQAVQPHLLDEADWIFTMTRAHRESILMVMPECEERIRLLLESGADLADPASGSLAQYRLARDAIAQSLPAVLRAVTGSN